MSTVNYIGQSDTLYILNKLKTVMDSGYVQKQAGKDLSTNDYTTADKNKLAGIATGAEVNQNAFSNVKVGSTTVAADAKTDTLEIVAGSNVTITPDATNDKITIAAQDTTYNEATTSAAGLMSASDKTKLNGIATGAEVNQNAFGNVKVGNTTIAADAEQDILEFVSGTSISISGNATDDKVTISVNVDTAMSDSSNNPVRNSVIKAYVDSAVGSITGVEFRKVQSLPATGENGVIYLLPKSGTPPTGNVYEEWIWISADSSYEKIGETSIDLSGYVQSSDLVEISTSDIDTMFTTVFGS